MNALTKLALFIALTINVFLIDSYTILLPLTALTAAVMVACRVQLGAFKWLLALMVSGFPLLAALFAIAGYEQTGTWPAGIRWGLYEAGIFTLRVKVTVLFNILLVRTTTVREFMTAFRWLRCPEQAILFLTTVIRFIPVSVAECRRIIEVQRCRGLRRRSLLTPGGLLPVLVPLLLSQVRRAHDLALCLEIRHFSWQAPKRVQRPEFSWADGVGWAAAAGLFILGNL